MSAQVIKSHCSMTKRSSVLRTGQLALLLCVSVFSFACRPQAQERVTLADVSEELKPRQESWDADLLISNDGVPRTILSAAGWQEFAQGDSIITLLTSDPDDPDNRVTALMFDADGVQSAEVKANEMQFFNDEDRFEATGNVIVVTATERTLETERLLWWESTGKILAPGFVKLTAPRETIQGYELDSDENLENYTLGRVTGQILVEE